MANIKVIVEHSVDVDLLTGGICIDVGCRGFQFSEAMRDLGCEVWAFDIEDMAAPPGINFHRLAVSDKNGPAKYVDTKDLQAKYLSDAGTVDVESVTLAKVYAGISTHNWRNKDVITIDLLKIDAEGSEYFILSDEKFLAVPLQISVEWHMHCHRVLHDQYYDKCMENLLKYYIPVQHVLTEAHGAGFNYWDSLWIRKDLML